MAPERDPAWQTPASPPLSGTRRATSCAVRLLQTLIIATPAEKDSLQPDGRRPLSNLAREVAHLGLLAGA